jgi:hypothetical protein
VHDAVIKEPPKAARPVQTEASASGEGEQIEEPDGSEPLSRAEEIRQRIEERREELRRAAEDQREEQGQNYQEAIQSMIQQSRKRSQEQNDEKDG